jgi:CRP-like cAMP-binding protein
LIFGPGDYFGETAIFRGEPYEATITARSDVRLLTLAAADLLTLSRKHPPLRRRLEIEAERREKRRQRRGKSPRGAAVDDEDDEP